MSDYGPGLFLLIAMMSMAVSMAIIPLMMRWAPALGMIDSPDARKVHALPVPRVGGVGIVIGTLTPLFIWLPFDAISVSFLIGSVVLLLFGVWDDAKELGHYVKFIGQFIAALTIVYYGDLYVMHFPLLGFDTLPEYIGKPFTVIAIVGMINAINHSDGLDGLAGGESLLSFGVIAYLAYVFEGASVMIIAAATIGGVFGFLRFNSHPAHVFMGDGGSQFLGYALAVLVVMLTQQVNPVMSPALALLILGLPIIDILAVLFLRIKHKLNLFRATRNHIHHRLLELGFYHYESVIIIYSIQILFVISSVFLLYENDFLIVGIYVSVCTLVFFMLTIGERNNWKVHSSSVSKSIFLSDMLRGKENLDKVPVQILGAGISLFIIASALMSTTVPHDFGISSLVLFCLLILVVFTGWLGDSIYKLVMFVTIGFSVYLLSTYLPDWLLQKSALIYVFFVIMTIAVFIAARIAMKGEFHITPLDYLVIIMTVVIGIVPDIDHGSSSLVWIVIQIIILFYACELTVQDMKGRLNSLTGAVTLALALIAFRGLI